jgi:hypothetical protein
MSAKMATQMAGHDVHMITCASRLFQQQDGNQLGYERVWARTYMNLKLISGSRAE